MATAADYRKWAEECFEWARQASDESVREQYASLGRVWLDYALRWLNFGPAQSRRQTQK